MAQSTDPCTAFPDDESLLEALRQRVEQAVRCLFKRNQKKIIKSLENKGCDPEDAKEAFQKGIIDLWLQSDRIVLTAKLDTYLYRIVYNKWMDILRGRKNDSSLDDEESELSELDPDLSRLLDPDLDSDMQEKLRIAFKQLTPKCQRLLDLLYFRHKSPQEVAKILGCSVDYVYSHKWRCINRLRQLLNP